LQRSRARAVFSGEAGRLFERRFPVKFDKGKIMLESKQCNMAGPQASSCPRRKKRPREGSHACGVAKLQGNVPFGTFLCAKEKYIEKTI